MNKSLLTPIVLFVYNRPWHTKETVDALKKNDLSDQSNLIIYSDAPKTEQDSIDVEEVRSYLDKIDGFKSVSVIKRESNLGLASSIINGVTEIVEKYGRVIVLEDDLVTSPFFLTYMNDALYHYKDNDRVVSIHGYVYPVKQVLPEAFFLKGADCWGWATWKRGWDCFNPDGEYLLQELKKKRAIREFDFNGAFGYSKMLKAQIQGRNDS